MKTKNIENPRYNTYVYYSIAIIFLSQDLRGLLGLTVDLRIKMECDGCLLKLTRAGCPKSTVESSKEHVWYFLRSPYK